jgi:hypothetical protein
MDEEAEKRMLGDYEWITPFSVNEYLGNAPLIKKLNEEKQMALAKAVKLREENRELSSRVHELEVSNTELTTKLGEADKRSTSVFFISLVAAVMAGLGGNFAASQPNNLLGWVLIILAAALEIILFVWQRRG